jgi:hypothetical protein
MALNEVIRGPFARTEIPERLRVPFKLPNGVGAVDLTGFSVTARITDPEGTTTTKTGGIEGDPTEGVAYYAFVEGDLDLVGEYRVMIFVESLPDVRLASDVVVLQVEALPGEAA